MILRLEELVCKTDKLTKIMSAFNSYSVVSATETADKLCVAGPGLENSSLAIYCQFPLKFTEKGYNH
jgi:hypothetical protein